MTDIVSRKVCWSMSSAPSSSSARAQSIDSAIDRRLLEVELADQLDDLDELARDALVELGRVQADDLELVLERRVVEPQVQAAALERLGQLARVVGGQQHDRVRAWPRRARARGSRSGSRERTSSSIASNSWSVLSISSMSSTTGSAEAIAVISGRCEQELLAEDVVLDVLPAGARGPRPGCAAAACGSSTRTAPWPRRGPRSTAGARACGPGSATAPWPARSCRRPAGPSTSTGLPSRVAR